MKRLYGITVFLHLSFTWTTGFNLGNSNSNNNKPPPPHKVRICQNKDCCRQWTLEQQGLPETLQDLLPPDAAAAGSSAVQVESTGCLSQCGKGPNLTMQNNHNNAPVMLHAVDGPVALARALQDELGIRVPSKLLAAVTVMEKARKGTYHTIYERLQY